MNGKYITSLKSVVLLVLLAQIVQLNTQKLPKNTITFPPLNEKTRNPIYDFATNLYLTVAKFKNVDQNMLISPFSIRTVSALIYLASRGQTAEEMRHALLLPTEHDILIEGLERQMASTQIPSQSKFDVGNGIFFQEGTYLNQTYSNIVKDKLRSEVKSVPFEKPDTAANVINNWVSQVTRNKINKLVNPSGISPATSIFLANALYFSGQWEKQFDEAETMQDTFRLTSGRNITVPMMRIENSFSYNYIKELGASGISLPFKDSRFEFIILKPDESLTQLERNLKAYPLNLLATEIKKQSRSVFLKMPRFRLNVHYDLVDVMKRLGIRSLFDTGSADISGLTKSGDKHAVSRIVHHTVLDINEKGATAAAGTTISAYPISSPSNFVLDKPFMFLLNDRLTGPVFIGRLENPVSGRSNADFTLTL